jgi:WD40 repeat protein
VTFSPDGQALAAVGRASPAGNALHVWDIASGRQRFTIRGPFRDDFVNVAFSPDSCRIACAGGDPRVGLWDAANGKELAMYRGHCSEVTAVAFSPDGRQILSASADGAVKFWDAHPRGEQLVLNPGGHPLHTAVSPDARRIATFAAPSGVVKVWDVTGKQVLSLKRSTAHDGTPVGTVAFSPKGDRLACVTAAISTGEKAWGGLTVWDGEGKELLNVEEENVAFFGVSLSPDGMRVAATAMLGDANDGLRRLRALRIWDIATGRQVLATEPTSAIGVFAVTFSPDGTRLATVADGWPGQPSLLVWDATTGAEFARWQVPSGAGTSVAFSPDGRRVAATIMVNDSPGELIVGDLVSGELMNLGHAGGSVTFSPDGARLASYIGLRREAAEICLWDASTGRQLLMLKGHAGMSTHCGLAFSPSGDRIVSTGHLWPASDDVEVKIWDATPLPRSGQP